MSVSDETKPYELLVRYDEDGRPKAAHIQHRRIVRVGDELLKNEPLPPQALALGSPEWDALLGDSLSAALHQVNDCKAEHERLTAELEAERGAARAASNQVEMMTEQAARDAKTIERLVGELEADRALLRQAERALRDLKAEAPQT